MIKQMRLKEYDQLAARTESIPLILYGGTDIDLNQDLQLTRLLHAYMGLCTEVEEFKEAETQVNAIEELGDTMWYLAVIRNTISVPSLQELIRYNPKWDQETSIFQGAHHWIAEMADVLKRCIYYGEKFTYENKKGIVPWHRFCVAYWGIVRWIEDTIMHHGLPSESELMYMNIEKLSKRYPDLAFKSDNAVDRDVENELSHISVDQGIKELQDRKLKLHKVMEELTSDTGMDITKYQDQISIEMDPNKLRKIIEQELLGISVNGFYEIMGYALDDFIVTVYYTVDEKLFIRLKARAAPEPLEPSSEVLIISHQDKFDVPIIDLTYEVFCKELTLRFPSFTDQLTFGGTLFSALDDYYSRNGCNAMGKAFKCGYVELMACRPSNTKEAHKDIWAVMQLWGELHVYGMPQTVAQFIAMCDDLKKLCLCPSMLKK